MYRKYKNVLRESQLFQNIDEAGLLHLLHFLNPKIQNYERHSFISMVGDTANSIGIILEGEAVVVKESAAGRRTVMALLKPGDIFGEAAAFSRKTSWPASVQAQEFCTLLFIPGDHIITGCENLCSLHRILIRNILGIISEKALMLNKKVEYLTIKSMREKIATYLLDQIKETGQLNFNIPMKRHELADFLSVSRPSMSREMSRMRDEGIIDFYKSSFTIKNFDALKSLIK